MPTKKGPKDAETFRLGWCRSRLTMGIHGTEGLSKTARRWGTSRQLVAYWLSRLDNPTTHGAGWGGHRANRELYDKDTYEAVTAVIWHLCKLHPESTLNDYCKAVETVLGPAGVPPPSTSWVARLFKKWNWSLKVPDRVSQLLKFSDDNLRYYVLFYASVLMLDPQRVKYVDECHVDHTNFRRKLLRGPRNCRVRATEHRPLKGTTISVTVVTSLDPTTEPLAVDVREGSNTQYDYLNFIAYLIESGFLHDGDVLIADNWAGHAAAGAFPFLQAMCDVAGVTLRRTPTYSPEFNAVELVFSWLKHYLRRHAEGNAIWLEVLTALSCVDRAMIVGFYRRVRSLDVAGI